MDQKIRCQSCAMPISPGWFGKEKDGTENTDYCRYCYTDGNFTDPSLTCDKMVAMSIDYMTKNLNFSKEEATKLSQDIIPKLKRWKMPACC